jgi:hypothetical protein
MELMLSSLALLHESVAPSSNAAPTFQHRFGVQHPLDRSLAYPLFAATMSHDWVIHPMNITVWFNPGDTP